MHLINRSKQSPVGRRACEAALVTAGIEVIGEVK